ncbi:MAG: hypothetical protein QOI07_3607 [Verrucomicrobiota bacterium]|jgi:hypothetical protein
MSKPKDPEPVWYYENGDEIRTFRSESEGEAWLEKNDPEGVLWETQAGDVPTVGAAKRKGAIVAGKPVV